ncbi:hypothetical protein CY35_04G045900 [Sphagnum magellanicum]|nr:hypothetical protein CY35_04G045900 [Sphagnum magellanicum]
MVVGLDERHHTYIQALMRRGPLDEKHAKTMFTNLFQSREEDGFFDFLGVVNKELDYVQMEIRGSANQYDGILYYGLVNKLANEEAKMGTRFTHVQICLFKAIMEAILQDSTGSGVISSMEALNLPLDTQAELQSQAPTSSTQAVPLHLTLAAKEETLASLVSDKWLSRTDNGQIALGVMAFLELRNFFKNFDLPLCDVCNEAAIKAQPCRNEACNVRMHSYCVPRKFGHTQVRKVCPECGANWKIPHTSNVADDNDNEMEENGNAALDSSDDNDEHGNLVSDEDEGPRNRVSGFDVNENAVSESNEDNGAAAGDSSEDCMEVVPPQLARLGHNQRKKKASIVAPQLPPRETRSRQKMSAQH